MSAPTKPSNFPLWGEKVIFLASWGGLLISRSGVPTEMLSPSPGLLIHNWRLSKRIPAPLGRGSASLPFVTGGDLFTDINMPIEGEAIDQGFGGFYYSSSALRAFAITADNYLKVDFGSGIISGILSNFNETDTGNDGISNSENGIDLGADLKDYSGEFILNNAKIGNSHSDFFEDNLTGTFNGKSYNGLYGGQFYGNNQNDSKPGTVAGTLGGISSDGIFTLRGYWMGDK